MDQVKAGVKAASPYVVAATVTALQLLQTVSALSGCAPSIGVVAGVALQTIQMAQAAEMNRDSCRELGERIGEIMIVFLTPYANGERQDVPPEMETSINRLNGNLQDISLFLQKLQKKSFFKQMFFSNRYSNRVSGFYGSLDWAINVFKVEAHINAAKYQYAMVNTVREIHLAVNKLTPQDVPAHKPTLTIVSIPPKPEIFYGREDIVEDIVQRMNEISNTRFAILGPGGLGKTSVALAVLQDPRTINRFGENRYWVACVQATSSSLFASLLARSLKLPDSTSNCFEQVLAHLKGDDKAKVILLDNFETPWDVEDDRSDIEHILCCLASIPQVSVLITMRSDQPPSTRLEWTRPLLPYLTVLTPEVSRRLYLHIDPAAENDPALDELLEALSYMPLAVMLMAKRGPRGETPTHLLARWHTVGTKMLHQGSSSTHSVRVSVRVSIESNTMKSNPDALALLSLLSLLPAGAPLDFLPRIAPSLDTPDAVFTLLQASLAYLGGDRQSIHVLSPIAHYVQEHHPPTDDQWTDLFKTYRQLLLDGGERRNDRRIPRVSQEVAKHVVNIEAVLKRAFTKPNPDVAIETGIILGWHQYFSIRHVGFIQQVLKAAEDNGRCDLAVRCKHCLADIKRTEARPDSRTMLEEVLPELRKLGREHDVASCLWSLGVCYLNEGRMEDFENCINEAKGIAEKIDCKVTLGECFELLAVLDQIHEKPADAVTKLETALQIFENMKPRESIGMIETLLNLAEVLARLEKYDEALEKLESAKDVIQDLVGTAHHSSWRLSIVGQVYTAQEKYELAMEAFQEGRLIAEKAGAIAMAVQCFVGIAEIYKRQGDFQKARELMQAAFAACQELNNQQMAAACMQELSNIDTMESGATEDGAGTISDIDESDGDNPAVQDGAQ